MEGGCGGGGGPFRSVLMVVATALSHLAHARNNLAGLEGAFVYPVGELLCR